MATEYLLTCPSILCSLYSVICSLFSVLCSLFSILCSLYSVLCTLYSIQKGANDPKYQIATSRRGGAGDRANP